MRRAIALGAIVGAVLGMLGVVILRARRFRIGRSSLRQFLTMAPAIVRLLDRLADDLSS